MYRIQRAFLIIFLCCSFQYSFSMEVAETSWRCVKSISMVEEKMHLPKNTLKLGVPATLTTAVLAAVWYRTSSESDIQNVLAVSKVTATVTGVLVTGYGALGIKHWWDFYALEKELQDAESTTKATGKKFKFATWHQDTWPLGHDLRKDAEGVIKQIQEDCTCKDKIFLGGKELDIHTISSEILKDAINDEKKALENNLKYVGGCCDAPLSVIALLGEEKDAEIKTTNSEFENINDNIGIFERVNRDAQWEDLVKAHKPHWFKRWFYFPGKRIWRFCFAPCYSRATKVYCHLLKQYSRLNALKDVADTMNWNIATEKPNQHVHLTIKK